MNQIVCGDKTYVYIGALADRLLCSKTVLAELCREGVVQARLVGTRWYANPDSVMAAGLTTSDLTPLSDGGFVGRYEHDPAPLLPEPRKLAVVYEEVFLSSVPPDFVTEVTVTNPDTTKPPVSTKARWAAAGTAGPIFSPVSKTPKPASTPQIRVFTFEQHPIAISFVGAMIVLLFMFGLQTELDFNVQAVTANVQYAWHNISTLFDLVSFP